MFNIKNHSEKSFSFNFSSDMWIVDKAILVSEHYLKKLDIVITFEFKTVLRELLINAVEHGNKNDFDRSVTCRIEHIRQRQIKITVEDEGNGFDHRCLDMHLSEDTLDNRNRGYAMIKAFTNRLEFNSRGNCITAYIDMDISMPL